MATQLPQPQRTIGASNSFPATSAGNAGTLHQSRRQWQTPAHDGPNGAPTRASDEASDPFPLAADVVGRPYLAPHRLAQITRDQDAAYAGLRAGIRHVDIEQLHRRTPLERAVLWLVLILLAIGCVALLHG
jgi:hypothetical protein